MYSSVFRLTLAVSRRTVSPFRRPRPGSITMRLRSTPARTARCTQASSSAAIVATGLLNGGSFAGRTLSNTVFLGILVLVVFGVVESLRGKEADIPTVSEAVRLQLY